MNLSATEPDMSDSGHEIIFQIEISAKVQLPTAVFRFKAKVALEAAKE